LQGALVRTSPAVHQEQLEGQLAWDCLIFSPSTVNGQGGGQHPPQIARALTEMGHHVLFVQPLMTESHSEGFSVYQDIFISEDDTLTTFQKARYQDFMASFCQESDSQESDKHRVALFTVFTPYLLQLIPLLKSFHFKIVYWCLDDWQHIGDPRLTLALETLFVQSVDSVFATSRLLAEKMTRLSGKPCPVISNGFSRQNFPPRTVLPPVSPEASPADMVVGPVKTFIYWGDLISPWVNWPLFIDIAQKNPQWTFNLIGRLYDNFDEFRYLFPENCHFLGQKRVDELHAYGLHADIGFIHFVDSPLIQAVNPVKTYEYLACRLPIISTNIPEIKDFPATYLIHDAEGFGEAVAKIDQAQIDFGEIESFLSQTTWVARAQRFLDSLS
jgi:glycosyltransferase involved in cell wall biosynthesis